MVETAKVAVVLVALTMTDDVLSEHAPPQSSARPLEIPLPLPLCKSAMTLHLRSHRCRE